VAQPNGPDNINGRNLTRKHFKKSLSTVHSRQLCPAPPSPSPYLTASKLATFATFTILHPNLMASGHIWEFVDAYRYQLATMAYAVGATSYHRLPALRSLCQELMLKPIGILQARVGGQSIRI
jgi:hypothetical protein